MQSQVIPNQTLPKNNNTAQAQIDINRMPYGPVYIPKEVLKDASIRSGLEFFATSQASFFSLFYPVFELVWTESLKDYPYLAYMDPLVKQLAFLLAMNILQMSVQGESPPPKQTLPREVKSSIHNTFPPSHVSDHIALDEYIEGLIAAGRIPEQTKPLFELWHVPGILDVTIKFYETLQNGVVPSKKGDEEVLLTIGFPSLQSYLDDLKALSAQLPKMNNKDIAEYTLITLTSNVSYDAYHSLFQHTLKFVDGVAGHAKPGEKPSDLFYLKLSLSVNFLDSIYEVQQAMEDNPLFSSLVEDILERVVSDDYSAPMVKLVRTRLKFFLAGLYYKLKSDPEVGVTLLKFFSHVAFGRMPMISESQAIALLKLACANNREEYNRLLSLFNDQSDERAEQEIAILADSRTQAFLETIFLYGGVPIIRMTEYEPTVQEWITQSRENWWTPVNWLAGNLIATSFYVTYILAQPDRAKEVLGNLQTWITFAGAFLELLTIFKFLRAAVAAGRARGVLAFRRAVDAVNETVNQDKLKGVPGAERLQTIAVNQDKLKGVPGAERLKTIVEYHSKNPAGAKEALGKLSSQFTRSDVKIEGAKPPDLTKTWKAVFNPEGKGGIGASFISFLDRYTFAGELFADDMGRRFLLNMGFHGALFLLAQGVLNSKDIDEHPNLKALAEALKYLAMFAMVGQLVYSLGYFNGVISPTENKFVIKIGTIPKANPNIAGAPTMVDAAMHYGSETLNNTGYLLNLIVPITEGSKPLVDKVTDTFMEIMKNPAKLIKPTFLTMESMKYSVALIEGIPKGAIASLISGVPAALYLYLRYYPLRYVINHEWLYKHVLMASTLGPRWKDILFMFINDPMGLYTSPNAHVLDDQDAVELIGQLINEDTAIEMAQRAADYYHHIHNQLKDF